ncbi:MAG: hypothetical protein HY694_03865 [Deltaproteobacteria bacterium]|nr:hypothetical protein [Deltaproteobacteria bacterium]
MKSFIIAAWLVLLVSVSQAQDRPARLPDDAYKSLLEVRDVKAVLNSRPLNLWWSERRKTREFLAPQISEFGHTIRIKELTYEALFNRYVPGGYIAEQRLYGENIQGFATLLVSGEKEDREEFIAAMRLVESQDIIIRQFFNPNRLDSTVPLSSWVRTRGTFGLDITAKESLFRGTGSLYSTVTVRTVDRTSQKETPGYEVAYVPALWRGVPKQEKVFPRPSSPTSHTIRAGRYFIWSRRTDSSGRVIDGPTRSLEVDQPRIDTTVWIP